MRNKSIVLYGSLALNVAFLVLLAWPGNSGDLVMAQTAAHIGAYSAVSAKGGGNQDALWLANRSTGRMVIYQYELGTQESPIGIVGDRDLRQDLEERQIGNLMLVAADISGSTSAVFVIDTDADRMVVYEYNRPNRTVSVLQKLDLRAASSGEEE